MKQRRITHSVATRCSRRMGAWAATAAGAGALMLQSSPAIAQTDWPEHAINIIVPGAPGGTTDVPVRLVAQKFSARLGKPVIVDNRAGSGGIIDTQAMVTVKAAALSLD